MHAELQSELRRQAEQAEAAERERGRMHAELLSERAAAAAAAASRAVRPVLHAILHRSTHHRPVSGVPECTSAYLSVHRST